MFIKLQDCYINTDSIDFLGVFDDHDGQTRQIGIILNGEKYTIYVAKGDVTENIVTSMQNNTRQIISQIINRAHVDVADINVPQIEGK